MSRSDPYIVFTKVHVSVGKYACMVSNCVIVIHLISFVNRVALLSLLLLLSFVAVFILVVELRAIR